MQNYISNHVFTKKKVLIFVSQLGFCSWFETSAKENINIDEAARALVTKVCGFSIFVDLSLL